MWSSAERIVACPVLLVLGATELILAIVDIAGLGLTARVALHDVAGPTPGSFSWGLASAALLCFALAIWAISTLVGMLTGRRFARASMRLIGAVHAALGGYLLLIGVLRHQQSPAWLGAALIAIGLWWFLSFRRAPLPA